MFPQQSQKLQMDDKQNDDSLMGLGPVNRNSPAVNHDLIVEEVGSSDLEDEEALKHAIQPDEFEEAISIKDSDNEVGDDSDIANHIKRLSCQDEPQGLTEEQVSRYIRKKKQWKARLFKRRYSQSSDDELDVVDDSDAATCNMGQMGRRLRRKTGDAETESPEIEHESANEAVSDPLEPMQVDGQS